MTKESDEEELGYSEATAPLPHNLTVRSHDALANFIPSGERMNKRGRES